MLRNAELAYYSNKLEINKSYHSKSCKVVIGDITGMNTSKPKHYSFSINDCMVTEKQKIANEFNHFFVNIGPQMADILLVRVTHYLMLTVLCTLLLYMICLNMMISILFCHNNISNAAGWVNFPAYLGKQCIDVYITPVTFILN